MPEAILTEEQLRAEAQRQLDKLCNEAGIAGGLAGLKRLQGEIEARAKADADRVAAEAAAKAVQTRDADLNRVLARACEADPNSLARRYGDAPVQSAEKYGAAALFSAARLRLQSLAAQEGFGSGNDGAVKMAAKMAREASSAANREYFETIARTLSAGSYADGGALIPEDFRQEMIPLYVANTVVRKYATRVPMPRGQITWPKQTSGVSPGFVPEAGSASVSTPQVGSLKLSAKMIRVLSPITNDLLRYAGPEVDVWIRNRLAQDFAVYEDAAFIRGTGSDASIKGLRYQAVSANVSAETKDGAAVTLQELTSDLFDMLDDLKSANVPYGPSWRWMSSPTAFSGVGLRLNANGVFVFRDEMAQGRLLGLGFDETTSIPNNLGGSMNQSEMYLVDFSNVIIGDGMGLEIELVRNATWIDGATTVSGINKDMSVFVSCLGSDVGLAHDQAVSIRTGVDWQVV